MLFSLRLCKKQTSFSMSCAPVTAAGVKQIGEELFRSGVLLLAALKYPTTCFLVFIIDFDN